MATTTVECLRCGQPRLLDPAVLRLLADDDCPRCGYVGWAEAGSLTERARQLLRERPVELRRLRPVA